VTWFLGAGLLLAGGVATTIGIMNTWQSQEREQNNQFIHTDEMQRLRTGASDLAGIIQALSAFTVQDLIGLGTPGQSIVQTLLGDGADLMSEMSRTMQVSSLRKETYQMATIDEDGAIMGIKGSMFNPASVVNGLGDTLNAIDSLNIHSIGFEAAVGQIRTELSVLQATVSDLQSWTENALMAGEIIATLGATLVVSMIKYTVKAGFKWMTTEGERTMLAKTLLGQMDDDVIEAVVKKNYENFAEKVKNFSPERQANLYRMKLKREIVKNSDLKLFRESYKQLALKQTGKSSVDDLTRAEIRNVTEPLFAKFQQRMMTSLATKMGTRLQGSSSFWRNPRFKWG